MLSCLDLWCGPLQTNLLFLPNVEKELKRVGLEEVALMTALISVET